MLLLLQSENLLLELGHTLRAPETMLLCCEAIPFPSTLLCRLEEGDSIGIVGVDGGGVVGERG